MSKDGYIELKPDYDKINKWFFPFKLLSEKTRKLINVWEKIDNESYNFIEQIFFNKRTVNLDDIGFIFNYFRFLGLIHQEEFNSEAEQLNNAASQLWPLFKALNERKQLLNVSMQFKGDPGKVEVTSEKLLIMFEHIFELSLWNYKGWTMTYNYLTYLEQSGQLQSFIHKRRGAKTNYFKTVVQQSITMFKGYLNEYSVSQNKNSSVHTIIGMILNENGLINRTQDNSFYNSDLKYYNKKAFDLDVDNASKKNAHLLEEMFPPHFLIEAEKEFLK